MCNVIKIEKIVYGNLNFDWESFHFLIPFKIWPKKCLGVIFYFPDAWFKIYIDKDIIRDRFSENIA